MSRLDSCAPTRMMLLPPEAPCNTGGSCPTASLLPAPAPRDAGTRSVPIEPASTSMVRTRRCTRRFSSGSGERLRKLREEFRDCSAGGSFAETWHSRSRPRQAGTALSSGAQPSSQPVRPEPRTTASPRRRPRMARWRRVRSPSGRRDQPCRPCRGSARPTRCGGASAPPDQVAGSSQISEISPSESPASSAVERTNRSPPYRS